MGERHSRDGLLEIAVACAIDEGLSKATFGRVARRAGVPDRTVVYYFPSRDVLVAAIVGAIVGGIQARLETALPPGRHDRSTLQRVAWASLSDPAHDRSFAVLLELLGLAATGIEPYAILARSMVSGFTDWIAERIDAPTGEVRQQEAGAAIALIDGLLIVRLIAGPAAGDAAAARLLAE